MSMFTFVCTTHIDSKYFTKEFAEDLWPAATGHCFRAGSNRWQGRVVLHRLFPCKHHVESHPDRISSCLCFRPYLTCFASQFQSPQVQTQRLQALKRFNYQLKAQNDSAKMLLGPFGAHHFCFMFVFLSLMFCLMILIELLG